MDEEETDPLAESEENEVEHDDDLRDVASSMVASWGYDREAETINVQFTNGHEGSYPCSPEQWEEAKLSPSPGRWMHSNVL